jgi:hypothetical protein
MASNLMARYAAEAQAEAKAGRHDDAKPARRGDYVAQAALDYHVLGEKGSASPIVHSSRPPAVKPNSR